MEQEDIDTGVLQLKSWFRAWSSYMPTAPLFEAEARLLVAEQVIENGGCVNPETLEQIECEAQ